MTARLIYPSVIAPHAGARIETPTDNGPFRPGSLDVDQSAAPFDFNETFLFPRCQRPFQSGGVVRESSREPLAHFKQKDLPKPRIVVLTPTEVSNILAEARLHWLEPALMLARYSGMRLGEIVQADWGDIDWHRGIIAVRRKLERNWQPKGRQEREIPVCAALSLYLKGRLGEPDQPIFFNTKGRCVTSQPHRALRRLCKRAGVRKVGFQLFRHTFATELLLKGASLYQVSLLLGHSIVTVTEQNYAHVVAGQLAQVVSLIGA